MPIEFLGILVVLVAVAAIAMWLLQRSRRQPRIEEDDPGWASDSTSPVVPEVFTRESLVKRDRTLDPSAWDNSPDGTGRNPQPRTGSATSEKEETESETAEAAVDSSFIEALRQRNREVSDPGGEPPSASGENQRPGA